MGVSRFGPEPGAAAGSVDECARGLVESIAAAAVTMASLRAQQLHDVAALTARMAALVEPSEVPAEMPAASEICGVDAAAAELSARLKIHLSSAYRLVNLSLALTTRLPKTFAAMAAGRIDEAKAKAVVSATELLTDAGAVVVEEAVAATIDSSTLAELRTQLAAEVHDLDPGAVERRARRATADRHLRFTALADGMAELALVGPATVLRPLYDRADALARDRARPGGRTDPLAGVVHGDSVPLDPDGEPVDRRGIDARRFDASTALLGQPLATAPSVGRGVGAHVTVAFTSALGVDSAAAQLSGYGAIPPAFAAELLRDHRFRRVLTDPLSGHLVAADGHTYPPGTLPRRRQLPPGDEAPLAQVVQPLPEPEAPLVQEFPGQPRRSTAGPDLPRTVRADVDLVHAPTTDPDVVHAPAPAAVDEAEQSALPRGAGLSSDPGGPRGSEDAHLPSSCPVAAAGGGDYAIPAAVMRFVHLRSPRCTAVGCRMPSWRCDVDHRVPWPEGPTCECNLAPKCRRHHLAKHRFGWAVTRATSDPADPSERWTSPLGHEYVVPAEPLLPRTTAWQLSAERGLPPEDPPPLRPQPLRYPIGDRGARSVADADRSSAEEARAERLRARQREPEDDPPPF